MAENTTTRSQRTNPSQEASIDSTGGDHPAKMTNLSVVKRALLELRLKNKGSEVASKTIIPRRPVNTAIPLSYAQQRLWFLNQLEPESPVYNESNVVRLSGPLDGAALEKTLNQVLARHESLRTTIVAVNGMPSQIINDNRSIELPVIDLQALPIKERETESHRLLIERIRQPFDLSRDLMIRVSLLRLAEQEHILLVVKHHIASDGWSTGIFWRDLAALYGAIVAGEASPLSELPVQYADYAIWQRESLRGEMLERHLSYWKKQLENFSRLQLPTDRPRPAVQSYRGAQQSFVLTRELSQSLKALSRGKGVTLYMTLLAAFQTLLHRYTGQDDIVVASPIAGRNRVELEGLIGFFINTLVLRANLTGHPSFSELMARMRTVCLDAYSHQSLPFEKVVEALQPERTLSHNPLVQVAFQLRNYSKRIIDLPDIEVEEMELEREIAKFDLTLAVAEKGEQLTGTFEYSTDLYDDATIRRMMGHYATLLQGIVANPEERLSDLPLLTAAERHQLLIEWNDTKTEYPRDKCIHELFEQQVEQTPDAIAVVFEEQSLSYRELNRRANQLAHYLKKHGVGREALVGICVERSLETIIGILGILKAGGAYVPLDPSYPKQRLEFMLEDSQAAVLMTQSKLLSALPQADVFNPTIPNPLVVCLDRDWQEIVKESQENLKNQTTAEDLAYVIYTSGSTGTPKGVAVEHRAVNRLVMNTDYVQLTSADVMAQASNASFDAATFEIWGALSHGARLVLMSKEIMLSPHDLASNIERHGITVLFLTTALFNQLVIHIPHALQRLHHLLFGGEAVDPLRVRDLLCHGPPKRLLHVYGPTETTTFASWYLIESVANDATTVPIGRPIANTQIHVLDSGLKPVPIGVPGELYIGGEGLARGYLNRPELTKQRFIDNPMSHESGARLYKTGDMVRYLPDGNIEFLGRIDDQVKIRGFRIELGEIESILREHPGVKETVVIVYEKGELESEKPDRQLAAYVVLKAESLVKAAELKNSLKQKLPEYMIPSDFVFLSALPLTPNGKVDRRALPSPDQNRPELDESYLAPRTPIEEVLVEIWKDVLKLEKIGIHDNFFELGGHSLLAVRLASEVERAFATKIPVASLFQSPTIAELAALLEKPNQIMESSLIAVQPQGIKAPFFCVHGYDGYFSLARHLGPDQPLYGLAQHLEGRKVRHTRIEEIASHYLKEMQTVQPRGPYLIGGHSIGGLIAFEMAQQLHRQGEGVSLLALFDPTYPRGHKSFLARISAIATGHCHNLWRRSLRGKAGYILRMLHACVARSLNAMQCKIYHVMDVRLPPKLRAFYVDEVVYGQLYARAKGKYRPQPYAGRMTFFKAKESRNDVGQWYELAQGGLKVYEVPGDHLDIIAEPGISVLAGQLKECLDCSLFLPQVDLKDSADLAMVVH